MCDVTGPQRSRCKACRYQRCRQAGMVRKERPEQVQALDGQQLCVVCGDLANGIHFGVTSCEGCKKFFRRGLQEFETYSCKNDRMCAINPKTRNDCRYCRYQKCTEAGMSREAIKMGRPKKDINEPVLLPFGPVFDMPLPEVPCQQQQNDPYRPHQGLGPQHQPHLATMTNFGPVPVTTSHHDYHPYRHHPAQPTRAQLKVHEQVTQLNMIPHLSYKADYHAAQRPNPVQESQTQAQVQSCLALEEWRRPTVQKEQEWSSGSSTSSGYNSDSDNVECPIDFSRSNDSNLHGAQKLEPHSGRLSDNGMDAPGGYRCVASQHESNQADRNRRGIRSSLEQWTPTVKVEPQDIPCVSGQQQLLVQQHQEQEHSHQQHQKQEQQQQCYTKHSFLDYRFPAKFWLRPNVPSSMARSPDDDAIVHSIVVAYHRLVSGFCNEEDVAAHSEKALHDEEFLKKRIMDHTKLTMAFVQAVPGFSVVDPADKFTIFRLAGVQLSILVAACNLYDLDTNTFKRNFYEQELQSLHPLFHFRNSVLDYAVQLQSLKLDSTEAALLVALVATATDWPDLKKPAILEQLFHQVLKNFSSYILERFGSASQRLNNILGYIPRLRQLGQWHYELTLRDVLAHY